MIIFKTLEFIRLNLNSYIINQSSTSILQNDPVRLGNVAMVVDGLLNNTEVEEGVYISMVNIQEETTFKNKPPIRVSETNPNFTEPPIYLNLYLLMSACYKNYNIALEVLSYVIRYFNSNKSFSFSGKPVSEIIGNNSVDYSFDENFISNLQLTLDIYSLTFEQLNYLWGALGGRQLPFVLYKARLVEIESDQTKKGGKYITEVHSDNPKV